MLHRLWHLFFRALGPPYQKVLCAERRSHSRSTHIFSIWLQQPGLRIVRKVSGKDLRAQPFLQIGLSHGKENFASFDKVARHPIGAAAVDLFFAAVGKVEDTAVFEKASHDASHANSLA